MAQAWWDEFPVTQAWNPPTEYGEDVGTPFHTYLTPPYPGRVTAAGYHPWGGEVDIDVTGQVPGHPEIKTEYLLHEDYITVQPGDYVTPDTVVGLSGGQTSGGSHPTDPAYSDGPHTEVGFFEGPAWGSTSVNPSALLSQAGGGAVLGGGTGTGGTPDTAPGPDTTLTLFDIPVLGKVTISSDLVWRAALIFAGLVLVMIGIMITFRPAAETAAKIGMMAAAPELAPATTIFANPPERKALPPHEDTAAPAFT